MAIEIVDLPIKNGDFHSYVSLPEGNLSKNRCEPIKSRERYIKNSSNMRGSTVHLLKA